MTRLTNDFKMLLADMLEHVAQLARVSVQTADEARLRQAICGLLTLLTDVFDVLDNDLMALDARTLASLGQLLKSFIGQPDFDHALTVVMRQVNSHLNTEAMSIFIWDAETNSLVVRYTDGPVREKVLGIRVPVAVGVVGWVVRNNEDLIVPSTQLDARFFGEIDTQTGFRTRSILCVPLVAHGMVIGAIEMLNKVDSFHDDDVKLLQHVSQMLSLCFEASLDK